MYRHPPRATRSATAPLIALAIAPGLLFRPVGLLAAEPAELGTVTVSAPRPLAPPHTPNTQAQIVAQRIADTTAINAEDALQHSPNLTVRKRFIGDRNSIIAVRSTSSRQSARGLVYADGILLSNLLGSDFGFGPRWGMVGAEDVAQASVLYGPFSALYPGNAMGATVLLRTRLPREFEGSVQLRHVVQETGQDGIRHPRGQPDAGGHQAGVRLGHRHGDLAWRFSLEQSRYRSQALSYATLPRSTTPALPSDPVVPQAQFDRDQTGAERVLLGVNGEGVEHSTQRQATLRVGYDFSPALQGLLTVGHWQLDRHSQTGSFLQDGAGQTLHSGPVNIQGMRYTIPTATFAPSQGEEARWLLGGTLRTRRSRGWNLELSASRMRVARDLSRTAMQAGSGAGTLSDGAGTGWDAVDLRASYQPDTPGHHWQLGYHHDHYQLRSRTWNTADWQRGGPTTANSAFAGHTATQALYAQHAWSISPAWKLTSGLRWEQWQAYGGRRALGGTELSYAARREQALSPKLALEFSTDSAWLWRASWGKAYRFPTVSELYQGRVAGNNLLNHDPNLRPEQVHAAELSVIRDAGPHQMRWSLYQDDGRDVLFSQTNTTVFPNVTSVQNVDRVRTRGIEWAWQGRNVWLDGLDIDASVAHNRAITLANRANPASVGKRFYRIPAWRADLLATWRVSPRLAWTVSLRHSGRQYNTLDNSDQQPNTFGGTSRYTVLGAKLQIQAQRQLRLVLGVDNLTRRRYFVFHPMPGRTWHGEAQLTF